MTPAEYVDRAQKLMAAAWMVRTFVKHSDEERGITGLHRARQLHGMVEHPALARLHNSFTTSDGLALVYEWLPGEVLYDYTAGGLSRDDPAGAHARFRALPVERILSLSLKKISGHRKNWSILSESHNFMKYPILTAI